MARYTRRRTGRSNARRKFVWDRSFGSTATDSFGADLLANYRAQPGATHVGATITRVRGYIIPSAAFSTAALAGAAGLRIDTWNEDPLDSTNAPEAQPDADWMAWLPWNLGGVEAGTLPRTVVTWNEHTSPWTVDIKAQRRLEELNQTLWLFHSQGAPYFYNLSIGLKLP